MVATSPLLNSLERLSHSIVDSLFVNYVEHVNLKRFLTTRLFPIVFNMSHMYYFNYSRQ